MLSRQCVCLIAAAVLAAGAGVASAQPVNDACGSATVANVGANAGTLVNATSDGACSCEGGGGADVYFRFTPAATGTFGFSLCQDAVFFDSVLSIHTACPASASNELTCDDDGCGFTADLSSLAAVSLQGGTTYFIRVAAYSDFDPGDSFVLNITGVTAGACCQVSATCTLTTAAGCATLGGVFQSSSTTCSPSPCPPVGACCDVNGCCTPTFQTSCMGTWMNNVACTPSPCPAPANDTCANAVVLTLGTPAVGFNCSATDDTTLSCAFNSPANTHHTVWYRFTATHTAAYTFDTCGTLFDSLLGVFSGTCGSLTQIACNDDSNSTGNVACAGNGLASRIQSVQLSQGQTYLVLVAAWGLDSPGGAYSLTANSVNTLGSCCAGATCTQTDQANCTGTFTASGVCSPNPCIPTGPCCVSGACTVTTQAACTGTWTQGGACSPNPCPQTGACCFGATCSLSTAAQCTGLNKAFAGTGTVCNTFSSSNAAQNRTPCCLANFNHSANPVEPTVQDVFDFLTAFFSNDPSANINGSQNSVEPTVQDVFDYLTVFFAGC